MDSNIFAIQKCDPIHYHLLWFVAGWRLKKLLYMPSRTWIAAGSLMEMWMASVLRQESNLLRIRIFNLRCRDSDLLPIPIPFSCWAEEQNDHRDFYLTILHSITKWYLTRRKKINYFGCRYAVAISIHCNNTTWWFQNMIPDIVYYKSSTIVIVCDFGRTTKMVRTCALAEIAYKILPAYLNSTFRTLKICF